VEQPPYYRQSVFGGDSGVGVAAAGGAAVAATAREGRICLSGERDCGDGGGIQCETLIETRCGLQRRTRDCWWAGWRESSSEEQSQQPS
jgi:hypothetical protein